jgi:hypothetical protein
MLWMTVALVLGSITAFYVARQRRRDLVFVSKTEPISVVYLRLGQRKKHVAAALHEASRALC